ncbi:hypothetical protein ABT383_39890, partial [Streptomyces humidus]|uniref:hypothetical protein n=1 Tax=Streptomyces humidus TaxID=52259 RepID=UPI00331BF34E
IIRWDPGRGSVEAADGTWSFLLLAGGEAGVTRATMMIAQLRNWFHRVRDGAGAAGHRAASLTCWQRAQ